MQYQNSLMAPKLHAPGRHPADTRTLKVVRVNAMFEGYGSKGVAYDELAGSGC
ncbi:hypothetical protein NSZ01_20190 [Nocardioides szechwanensis]|nr:hypothetical protein NSZ01_20190 [Nocardioides szechwanensis]